jgi:membrane protein DedA with SNARE-associated domain
MSWPRFLFWNAFGGIVWATGVGLIAFFGGKALADAITRYGLYAGVAIVGTVVVVIALPRLIRSVRKLGSDGHDGVKFSTRADSELREHLP